MSNERGRSRRAAPFLVPKIYRGGLAAFEDRYGLGVVGVGEHVDRRDLEQVIVSVEELVQVALLGHGIAADIGDTARLKCAGGLKKLGRGAGARRVDGENVNALVVIGSVQDVIGGVVGHKPSAAGEAVELGHCDVRRQCPPRCAPRRAA